MSNGYQREVVDFLKEYGATGVDIVPGGKHPKVEFEFRGKHRTYAIAGSPGDHRASANTIADLRRLLGAPIEEEEPESRRLVDMLPDAPDRPTFRGRMACYLGANKNFARLRFIPPPDLIEQLGIEVGQYFTISVLDKDTWHLHRVEYIPGSSQPLSRARLDAKQIIIDLTVDKRTPFGVSPADFSVVGDAIVAHLHSGLLNAVGVMSRLKHPAARPAKEAKEPAPAPEPSPRAVEVTAPLDMSEPVSQRLRGLLAMIGSAERQTGYRLVKARTTPEAEPAWMWRAPDIRL